VRKVLVEHPEIKKLEVRGYTDNRGDSKANKLLSEQRAQAVVKWLVASGVEAARLSAVGYGDENPVDTNSTESGRKTNRRVEFHATEVAHVDHAAPAQNPPAPAPYQEPEEKKP
jgi:outer membrane protein OmpA-like peptidoglycan-associated protein